MQLELVGKLQAFFILMYTKNKNWYIPKVKKLKYRNGIYQKQKKVLILLSYKRVKFE